MTNAAREEILARIRSALSSAPPPTTADIPRFYARTRPQMDLLAHFVERVEDYRAGVDRVSSAELAAAVAAACSRYGVHTVVVPPDTPEEWLSALDAVQVRRDGDPNPLSTAELDGVDAVLTGAAVGIAETGTLVLDSGPQQGRRALSLVPDVHLCVVRTDQVVDDVPAAVGQIPAERPLTWISGPSATSDIELERVEGVHGPRTLHVLLVEGGTP